MSFLLPLLLASALSFNSAAATALAAPLSTSVPEVNESLMQEPLYDIPRVYIEDGSVYYVKEYAPVTIRVEDEYGHTLLDDSAAQWRTHGNHSLSWNKHNYKIKLSSSRSLLGMDSSRYYILVSNAADKTLLRNALALELSQSLGVRYTSDFCFVDVFLNGEYRGNYLMVEAIRIGSKQVNIHPAAHEYLFEVLMGKRQSDGVTIRTPVKNIILEVSSTISLDSTEEDWLREFFRNAETALLSGKESEIEQYFDIDSFLRVYLLNEYSKNADTAFASSRFYIKGGRLYAGPPWDFDISFGNDRAPSSDNLHWINFNCPGQSYGWYATSLWWEDLCSCDWFQKRFAKLYIEMQPVLVNLYEDNELGTNRLDARTSAMEESIENNFLQWSILVMYSRTELTPGSTYEANLKTLRSWLRARNEWILSQLNSNGDFIVQNTRIR